MELDDIVTASNLESDLELSIETIKNSLRRAPRKLKILYRVPLHLSHFSSCRIPNCRPHGLRTLKRAVHHCLSKRDSFKKNFSET